MKFVLDGKPDGILDNFLIGAILRLKMVMNCMEAIQTSSFIDYIKISVYPQNSSNPDENRLHEF